MFFRGRGTTYLVKRDEEGNAIGPAVAICQDALNISLATEAGEHINKCGLVDAPDLRYPKTTSGTVTLTYADVEDKKFAIGVLGHVSEAGSPGTVTDEGLPDDLVEDDVYFLGGTSRHRTITGLVINDGATSPTPLVVDTDYTLDAATGKVTFISDLSGKMQPFVASYGYTDPGAVSLLSEGQGSYALFFEYFNVVDDGRPGSLELYNVRFDPAQNLDFLSDDLMLMELTGTMLVDPSKPVDPVLGQFGRRVTGAAAA